MMKEFKEVLKRHKNKESVVTYLCLSNNTNPTVGPMFFLPFMLEENNKKTER